MLNEKAQVMILLKEAAAVDCLARALDIVTGHTRGGTPDWARIRLAIEAMLVPTRPARATPALAVCPPPARQAG
jgi:hypothetical protein